MKKRVLAAGIVAMVLATGCGARKTPVQENYGADTGITLYDTEDTSADRTNETDEIDPGFSVDVDENMAIDPVNDEDTATIGVPSPYADYDSLEEAEDAAGFDLALPEFLNGANISACVISDTTIQVIAKTDDNRITIRKSLEEGDISGDYTVYDTETNIDYADRSLEVKGNGGEAFLAIWEMDGYSYSVMLENGVSMDEMEALAGEIE